MFAFFLKKKDGYSGFVPGDARYLGNGLALSFSAMNGSTDELAGVVGLNRTPDFFGFGFGESPQNPIPQPHPTPTPQLNPCAAALAAIAPGLVGENANLLLAQGQQQGLSAAQLAYVFASAQHETDSGNTMTEYGSGRKYNGRVDLGNTQPGDGPRFKGRGFVQ